LGGDILPNKVGSGGTKKTGRNKVSCAKYAQEHRREKNKVRRWKKIIKHLLPNNNTKKELEARIRKVEASMGV